MRLYSLPQHLISDSLAFPAVNRESLDSVTPLPLVLGVGRSLVGEGTVLCWSLSCSRFQESVALEPIGVAEQNKSLNPRYD